MTKTDAFKLLYGYRVPEGAVEAYEALDLELFEARCSQALAAENEAGREELLADLLYALQNLLGAWDCQMAAYEEMDVAKQARAAIAKATQS